MKNHAERCVSHAAETLGAADAREVDTYELFQTFPWEKLLSQVIEGLEARGIGLVPDPRYCDARLKRYDKTQAGGGRCTVILFRLQSVVTRVQMYKRWLASNRPELAPPLSACVAVIAAPREARPELVVEARDRAPERALRAPLPPLFDRRKLRIRSSHS
jgi:hypothetical protein